MRSLAAYWEKANGANISQSNVARERSRNMMLAYGWITSAENRQFKAEAGVRSRQDINIGEGLSASPAHTLFCQDGLLRRFKSSNTWRACPTTEPDGGRGSPDGNRACCLANKHAVQA